MSSQQEKFYHGDAVAYLQELGIDTHGVWRDLSRHDLTVVKEGKVNWTTQEALDELADIFLERRANKQEGKLTDFAPNVSDSWKTLCRKADIRLIHKRVQARYKEE